MSKPNQKITGFVLILAIFAPSVIYADSAKTDASTAKGDNKHSRIEVWSDDKTLQRIFRLESSPYEPSSFPSRKTRRSIPGTGAIQYEKKKNTQLAKLQPTLTLLPSYVLGDPGVLVYLHQLGMTLPDIYFIKYGPDLSGLSPDPKISPASLADPQFNSLLNRLKSLGLPPPKA